MLEIVKNLRIGESKKVYEIKQVSCHAHRSIDGLRLQLTRQNGRDIKVIKEVDYQDFLDTLQTITDTFPERKI